jgi:hypothetical protein
MPKSLLKSSLLSGTMVALLSAIPYIGNINICCCMWLVLGGFWGAYLVWFDNEKTINVGQGFFAGTLGGIWAAFMYSLLTTVVWQLMSQNILVQLNQTLEETQTQVPAEMMDFVVQIISSPILSFLTILLCSIVVFPTVMCIGGMVGASILAKKKKLTTQQ